MTENTAPDKDCSHQPVMLREVLHYLKPDRGGVFVDATLGYGGHSERIAAELGPEGLLLGLDLDSQALQASRVRAESWPCRTLLVEAGFDELPGVLNREGLGKVDGILFDLGVSSPQLDQAERGFSFSQDGPLDMRMNNHLGLTAAEYLATVDQSELVRVLRKYGEEQRAVSIARTICQTRQQQPLNSTADLKDVVMRCFPDRHRAGNVHPATRTFQALRIVINNELGRLSDILEKLPGCLNTGGRCVFLAYHSLEDRLVKQAFRRWTRQDDEVLSRIPVPGEIAGWMKTLTKGALKPTDDEVQRNPRARSARCRAAERSELPWGEELFGSRQTGDQHFQQEAGGR